MILFSEKYSIGSIEACKASRVYKKDPIEDGNIRFSLFDLGSIVWKEKNRQRFEESQNKIIQQKTS